MKKLRNALLIAAMLLTAAITWRCLAGDARPLTIPTLTAAEDTLSPLEHFRLERNETELRNMAALELLCAPDQPDETLRHDAAVQLQTLIDARQKQLAMEAILLESGFGACTAVLTNDQLTIVTDTATLTDRDNALLLELSQLHAGVSPQNLRVICAGQ